VQKLFRYLVAGFVVLVLGSFAFTYTVRFTETAVKTTFGKASADGVIREPGLYFRLPFPFQEVTKYDTRTRLLTLKVETQQTADNRQVAVEVFCTWRVSDPLKFFQTFSTGERAEEHFAKAEQALQANLRSAAGATSNFTMQDLFTAQAGASKLAALEAMMKDSFTKASGKEGQSLDAYGIEAVSVGMTRILMPQEVTAAVFERMKAGRERIKSEIESQGQSQAQTIRDRATSDAQKISAFAERLAQDIRSKGDSEVAPYLEMMNQNPQLAVYLEQMEFIRGMNPRTATLVVPSSYPGFNLLMPDALNTMRAGEIPAFTSPEQIERAIVDMTGGTSKKPASGGTKQ
jgi:modulator of FtsH protease HflC